MAEDANNAPAPGPQPSAPNSSPPASALKSPAVWLATGLGVGLAAKAPGTFGTLLVGLPVAWTVSYLPGVGWQILAIAILFLVGVPICTSAGRALGTQKDNQAIVWDEIASMPAVFLLVPLASIKIAAAGFVLHRLFDITKPPPCTQLEWLPEGLGVMADDLMAAIYACLALFGVSWLASYMGWPLLAMG